MKKNKILIICTASIIALIGIIFIIICLATDAFKSNKTLFYKYASQIDLKEMIDLNEYNTYLKRLGSEGHANEGEISIDIASQKEKINESITWTGYTDSLNNKSNYDISVKKDKIELLGLNYLKNGDMYGILFKDIVNQYIAIENNNLKDFASKIGINPDNIPNKIESTELKDYIDYDELKPTINKYINIVINQIPENRYSKIKKQNVIVGDKTIKADGYQVKIYSEDIKKASIKVLEKAKDDEDLFEQINKIDNAISFEKYHEDIQKMLESINNSEKDENTAEKDEQFFTVTVYKQGKNTVKLSAKLMQNGTDNNESGKLETSIEKTNKGMIIKFEFDSIPQERSNLITISKEQNTVTIESKSSKNITYGTDKVMKENNIKINIIRNGAFDSSNVEFTVDASILSKIDEQSQAINIKLENTTDFSSAPEIAEYTNENKFVINTLSKEQTSNLFINLDQLIAEKLKDEQVLSSMIFMTSVGKNLFVSSNDLMNNTKNDMGDQEKDVFNSQFEIYGGSISGTSVRELIKRLETNNSDDNNHKIEYDTSISIENSKLYNITFEKNSEGYINKVNIEDV